MKSGQELPRVGAGRRIMFGQALAKRAASGSSAFLDRRGIPK
jgi:hypothetical protein